jgi:hypothetical protein
VGAVDEGGGRACGQHPGEVVQDLLPAADLVVGHDLPVREQHRVASHVFMMQMLVVPG